MWINYRFWGAVTYGTYTYSSQTVTNKL